MLIEFAILFKSQTTDRKTFFKTLLDYYVCD